MTTTELIIQDRPPLAKHPKFPSRMSQDSKSLEDPSRGRSLSYLAAPAPKSTNSKGSGGSISDGVRQKLLVYLMNKKRPADGQALVRSISSATCNSSAQGSSDLGYEPRGQHEAGTRKNNPLKRCQSIRSLHHRSHPYHHKIFEMTGGRHVEKSGNNYDKSNPIPNFRGGELLRIGARHVSQPTMVMGGGHSPDSGPMRKTFSESDLKNKRGLLGLGCKMSPARHVPEIFQSKMSTGPTQLSSPEQAMDLSFRPAKVGNAKELRRMPPGLSLSKDVSANHTTDPDSMEITELGELERLESGAKQPNNSVWQSLPNIPKGIADRAHAVAIGPQNVGKDKNLKVKHHPYSIDCLVYNGRPSSRGHSRNVPSTSPIQESMNVTPPPMLSHSQPPNSNPAAALPMIFPQSSNLYLGGPLPAYNYFQNAAATAYMMYCCSLGLAPQLPFPGPFYPPPPFGPQPSGQVDPFSAPSSTYSQEPATSQALFVRASSQNKRWSDGGENCKDLAMDHDSALAEEPPVFRNRGASTGGRIPYKPRYHRMFVLKAEAEAAAALTSFERTNSEPIPPPNFAFNDPSSCPGPAANHFKPQLSFPPPVVVGRGGISKCKGSHRQPISKPLKKCVSEWKLRQENPLASHAPIVQKSTSDVYNYTDARDGFSVGGDDKAGNKQRLKEAILQWVANKSPSTSTTSNCTAVEKCLVKSTSSIRVSSKRLKRVKNIDIPEDHPMPPTSSPPLAHTNNDKCHQNIAHWDSFKAPHKIDRARESPKNPTNGLSLSQRREEVNHRISVLLSKGITGPSMSMEQRAASRMVSEIEAVNALASLSMTQSR